MADREQLRRAQRPNPVVQLDSALAHDLRNALAIIRGNAEMLSLELPGADRLQKRLQEILRFADRVSVLTGELLAAAGRPNDGD
jgi:nitrogen-specific signal transduction histidine kinase